MNISIEKIILIIISYYLITNNFKNNNIIQLLIIIGTVFILCNNNIEGINNNDDNTPDTAEERSEEIRDQIQDLNQAANRNTESDQDPIVANNTVKNDGSEPGKLTKASIINMGPYDGLCLKSGGEEYWMKSPQNTPLVPNDKLYTYLSNQGPVKMSKTDNSKLIGPPVDGVKGSPEKMFMWANNVTSPLCCPSTFSSSTGCVCSTKNQRDFINGRGMINKTEIDSEI
jgi:hypothetical protein